MADVFKIAVEIALAGTIVLGLEAISSKLLGINTKVKEVEGGLKRWALAVGGIASIMVGAAALHGMAKLVDAGREMVHQQELMKIAGMSNQQIAEATAKAYENSAKVQTTTISENLKHLRDLRCAFGNIDTATKYLEDVTKACGLRFNGMMRRRACRGVRTP